MAGELEGAHLYSEALIAQLAKEAENGRLLRLLTRLSMVVDRPAGEPDAHWSETGASQCQSHGLQKHGNQLSKLWLYLIEHVRSVLMSIETQGTLLKEAFSGGCMCSGCFPNNLVLLQLQVKIKSQKALSQYQ